MGLNNSKICWNEIPKTIYQIGRFIDEATLWSNEEKNILKEVLQTLIRTFSEPGFPWSHGEFNWQNDPILQEYFRRVKLAIPKSDRCAEIFRWSDDPTLNPQGGIWEQKEDFTQAPRRIQIGLSHLYALFLYLWSLHEKKSPSERFYRSDIPYHMFQSGDSYNTIQMELFLGAIEKLVDSEVPPHEGELPKQIRQEKCGECLEGLVRGRNFVRRDSGESTSESKYFSEYLCDRHRVNSESSTVDVSLPDRSDDVISKLNLILHRLEIIYRTQSKYLEKRRVLKSDSRR